MKHWKESRNYRRIKDANGNVVANIITVYGEDIEVSEDIFLAYSQADRRERYVDEEEDDKFAPLSWEKLAEDAVQDKSVGAELTPTVEDAFVTLEARRKYAHQMQSLEVALSNLSDADRKLIDALFFRCISTRKYAKQLGLSDTAIRKRRDRALKKIKKFLKNF
jgi:RNA polymerase sigma factor (sigma-70 family)